GRCVAFETSVSHNMRNEGTYVTDLAMPLRATLSDLPNGCICLSTAGKKIRRNHGTYKEKSWI
ncbi:27972_t:CDS:1, partial [Gigaspora margarita]